MSYEIICPYCFSTMLDTQVHFRSEKVNKGQPNFLPDDFYDFDDIDSYIAAKQNAPGMEEVLRQLREWEFFMEKPDPLYERFWNNFNGTTEYDPAAALLGVNSYLRPIIDPQDGFHQHFLKRQPDNTYFIYDPQGMVKQIELTTGEVCHRRVCPHCHNPLPNDYGKNPVRFATVVGIVGAGKTVYLSQLLRNMANYSNKVGLNAIVNNSSVRTFLENNVVAANQPLPGSTPAMRLQQPLFYEMIRNGQGNQRITETFVLYDVAGEVFTDQSLVQRFAPFVEHANGIILLIDPMQLDVINGAAANGRTLSSANTALETIHNIVSKATDVKSNVPVAVCLSKVDIRAVQEVLVPELRSMLLNDVHGIPDAMGYNSPLFNAQEYAPIAHYLRSFIMQNEPVLANLMRNNYSTYAYFAFTSLGCDVQEMHEENGNVYQYPVGPVLPKRMEEPLLWLFYKLGYIGANGLIPGEIMCPNCGRTDSWYELPPEAQWVEVKTGLFKKERYHVSHGCSNCGYRWENPPMV